MLFRWGPISPSVAELQDCFSQCSLQPHPRHKGGWIKWGHLQCLTFIAQIFENHLNFFFFPPEEKNDNVRRGSGCLVASPPVAWPWFILALCCLLACLLLSTFLPCLSLSTSPNPTHFSIIYFPPLSPESMAKFLTLAAWTSFPLSRFPSFLQECAPTSPVSTTHSFSIFWNAFLPFPIAGSPPFPELSLLLQLSQLSGSSSPLLILFAEEKTAHILRDLYWISAVEPLCSFLTRCAHICICTFKTLLPQSSTSIFQPGLTTTWISMMKLFFLPAAHPLSSHH